MPRTPTEYSNTIIHKIVCNDLTITDAYVGHTTNFISRKSSHKASCNNIDDKAHGHKLYKVILENGGWDNWSMIQIEKCQCSNGNEARTRERHWYELLNAKLNAVCPITSKEEKTEGMKLYYENNKEAILKRIHEYGQENKDLIATKNKIYRQKNELKIKELKSVICQCDCGVSYTQAHKQRHLRSKKHINSTIDNNSEVLDV